MLDESKPSPYAAGYPGPTTPYVAQPQSSWQPPFSTLAIVSFVLSLVPLWMLGSLAAIITGHIARGQIRRTGERGGGLALAALIIGYIGFVFGVLVFLAAIILPIFLSRSGGAADVRVHADVRNTVANVQTWMVDPQDRVLQTYTGQSVITGDDQIRVMVNGTGQYYVCGYSPKGNLYDSSEKAYAYSSQTGTFGTGTCPALSASTSASQ